MKYTLMPLLSLDPLHSKHDQLWLKCLDESLKSILIQWAWFSLSTGNFIGSGQNSAHSLLDDRWIACSAIMGVAELLRI